MSLRGIVVSTKNNCNQKFRKGTEGGYDMFTRKNTLKEIMTDPRIAPYADRFIVGLDLKQAPFYGSTIEEISRQRIFHGYSLLNGFNRLLEAAEEGDFTYPLYTEEEIKADPRKEEAYFMYFPSMDPDADERPFLVCVPGGGNTQIWNISEGFPIANHYNQLGYHVVVLNYRVGGKKLYPAPLADMAQLLRYIEAHKAELHLNAGHYFIAGFSAGGYLVDSWCTDNHGYPAYGLPAPIINISVYGFVSWRGVRTGHDVGGWGMTTHGLSLEEAAASDWNVEDHISSFPPTYILHGDNDHACDFINSRILADALQNAGIPYEFEIGHGMDHGFGEALFSELRGWIERSVAFLNKFEGVAERK